MMHDPNHDSLRKYLSVVLASACQQFVEAVNISYLSSPLDHHRLYFVGDVVPIENRLDKEIIAWWKPQVESRRMKSVLQRDKTMPV